MFTALNWTLGPYRIAREIDRGQFGTVYEATDADGRRIALKLVPVQGADSEEKVAAERQGAALQQRFSRTYSDLVPEVLDHQRIDPYYAIAMELVTGVPLTTLIKAERVPADRAATIARAICRFLEKAHEFTTNISDNSEALIVHGDLKPAHILLLPDDSIRVLDFGIAKALAIRKAATTNRWGSVDYASPERLESGRVNEQADFWSVGVILFEMLAGCRPYLEYEHNQSRLETAIRRQEPRLRVPPDVDPRLAAIVDKLLAPQVEHRYQSARHITNDLDAFLAQGPVAADAEATRAGQDTVRIAPGGILPRSETTVPTDPLVPVMPPPIPPVLPRPVPSTAAAAPPPSVLPSAPPVPAGAAAATASTRASYNAGTAAVLSLLIPGVGQLYNRDFLRGIFWLIVTPGFWIGSAGLIGWPFHLISSYTAYRRARVKGGQAPPASAAPQRVSFFRRRAPGLVLVLLGVIVVFEALAVGRAQQLREQVPSLDVTDVAAVRAAYRQLRSPFGLGSALLAQPLAERLVDLADRTIVEFRAETPALVRRDWEHARDALDLAAEITPSDSRIAAKRQYVLGRLAWMTADGRGEVDRAIRLLRDAARLDPSSPDPYLGLAAIHAYSTRDLPGLTQAIDDAEARGYRRGRRERAELGDLYKVLGDRSRAEARNGPRDQRLQTLKRAREHYAACTAHLDGLHLGASEKTLAECRRREEGTADEIERLIARQIGTAFRLTIAGL